MAGLLNKILPDTDSANPSTSTLIQASLAKKRLKDIELNDLTKVAELLKNTKGGLSQEDTSEFFKILNERKEEIVSFNEQIISKVTDRLKKGSGSGSK